MANRIRTIPQAASTCSLSRGTPQKYVKAGGPRASMTRGVPVMSQKANRCSWSVRIHLGFVILALFMIQSGSLPLATASVPVSDGVSETRIDVSADEKGKPVSRGLSLTAEESAWLDAHPEITIAFDGDYAPYSFQNVGHRHGPQV